MAYRTCFPARHEQRGKSRGEKEGAREGARECERASEREAILSRAKEGLPLPLAPLPFAQARRPGMKEKGIGIMSELAFHIQAETINKTNLFLSWFTFTHLSMHTVDSRNSRVIDLPHIA